MEISKSIELSHIKELKILQNVRLINKADLNPVFSKENLRVQFDMSGDVKGSVTCYLCIDGKELGAADRNYIYPLFVESMNILVGRQISLDRQLINHSVKVSAPKFSMNSTEINTALRGATQKYSLDLDYISFTVLLSYQLQAVN